MAELRCRCFISIDGAAPVPFQSLTQEQAEKCKKIMSERLSKTCSTYFTNHPDEYAFV